MAAIETKTLVSIIATKPTVKTEGNPRTMVHVLPIMIMNHVATDLPTAAKENSTEEAFREMRATEEELTAPTIPAKEDMKNLNAPSATAVTARKAQTAIRAQATTKDTPVFPEEDRCVARTPDSIKTEASKKEMNIKKRTTIPQSPFA